MQEQQNRPFRLKVHEEEDKKEQGIVNLNHGLYIPDRRARELMKKIMYLRNTFRDVSFILRDIIKECETLGEVSWCCFVIGANIGRSKSSNGIIAAIIASSRDIPGMDHESQEEDEIDKLIRKSREINRDKPDESSEEDY